MDEAFTIVFPLSLQPELRVNDYGASGLGGTEYVPLIWIADANNHRIVAIRPRERPGATPMTMDVANQATLYVRWLEEVEKALSQQLTDDDGTLVVRRRGTIDVRTNGEAITSLHLVVELETKDGQTFDRVRKAGALLQPMEELGPAFEYLLGTSKRKQLAAATLLEEMTSLVEAWQETDRVAPSGSEQLRIRKTTTDRRTDR
jgi:hypothetical protein